jgi:hypothetical protein
MRLLVLNNALAQDTLVWREGMPDWQPLVVVMSQIVGEGQVSSTPAQSISYYNPVGGIDQRVTNTLKGFPAITGPRDEWPMSEMQLMDLARAEKARKTVRALAQTMRALGVLWALCGVIFLVVFVFAAGLSPRGGGMALVPALGLVALFAALAALGFLTARASMRCQVWAPITAIVIMGAAILLNLFGFLMASGSGNSAAAGSLAVTGCIGSLIPILVLIAAIRALMGIKTFLQSPVWAQEALVYSKL